MKAASSALFSPDLFPVYLLPTPQGWVSTAFRGQALARLELWQPSREAAWEAMTGLPWSEQVLAAGQAVALQAPAGPLKSIGTPPLRNTLELLLRYFQGEAVDFSEVPVDLSATTPFRRRVLEASRSIPFGSVVTYGYLAALIGEPAASRAVGGALGSNPVPVVVPCHRVVGSGGQLTGFTGGLHRKETLLALEGLSPQQPRQNWWSPQLPPAATQAALV